MSDEWDDYFDKLDDPTAHEWSLRKQCAYLVSNSVGHRDELEDEQGLFLDPDEPYTLDELKEAKSLLILNQRHPLDCWAPRQKDMIKHFRKICGL